MNLGSLKRDNSKTCETRLTCIQSFNYRICSSDKPFYKSCVSTYTCTYYNLKKAREGSNAPIIVYIACINCIWYELIFTSFWLILTLNSSKHCFLINKNEQNFKYTWEFPFQSLFSIHLSFQMNREYFYCINSLNKIQINARH